MLYNPMYRIPLQWREQKIEGLEVDPNPSSFLPLCFVSHNSTNCTSITYFTIYILANYHPLLTVQLGTGEAPKLDLWQTFARIRKHVPPAADIESCFVNNIVKSSILVYKLLKLKRSFAAAADCSESFFFLQLCPYAFWTAGRWSAEYWSPTDSTVECWETRNSQKLVR